MQKSIRNGCLLVIPPRLERGTCCLEGSCSIQLSYGTIGFRLVGIARFELATSCSQSRRDNRTTLYPVFQAAKVHFFLNPAFPKNQFYNTYNQQITPQRAKTILFTSIFFAYLRIFFRIVGMRFRRAYAMRPYHVCFLISKI